MQYLKTLSFSFPIWQLFSLCPFTFTKHTFQPKIDQKHTYIVIISVAVQFCALVHGLCDFDHYTTSVDRSRVVFLADIISMALIRFTAIVIMIESWLKRGHQIEFLTKVEEIDLILRTNLMIDLKYELRQKLHIRKLFVWIGTQLSLELAMLTTAFLVEMPTLRMYWLLYTIPLFICMTRYQQFISYVDLLHDRFKALNKHVETLTLSKHRNQNILSSSNDPTNPLHYKNAHAQMLHFRDVEAFLIYNKLKHLQKVYRALLEATEMLNRLFRWSILLNMGNDFFNVTINLYWVIVNFVRNDSKLELVGVFSWGIFDVIMLISVSKACHFACHQANKFPGVLQSIDLGGTNRNLDLMV